MVSIVQFRPPHISICIGDSAPHHSLWFWVCALRCWMSLSCFFTNIFYQCLILSWWLPALLACYAHCYPIWTTDLGFLELGNFDSAIAYLPGCFIPLDNILEYCVEHVTIGLLYVKFIFSTRILYRGILGFATVCSCGVWHRGLTTCLL